MRSSLKHIVPAIIVLFIASCKPVDITPDTPTPGPTPVEPTRYSIKDISQMTLWEKVGQMFCIIPYNWTGDGRYYTVEAAELSQYAKEYPAGGYLLKAENIKNPDQIVQFTEFLHSFDNYPFLSVDEEGGTVTRVARNSNFNVPKFESAYSVGSSGNGKDALTMGTCIGAYLYSYGFDVDFAPVADVWTNPDNTVIGKRAFSSKPDVAATMVVNFLQGLHSTEMEGCLKHFPGHGDTSTDSHSGYASTEKTWEEMLSCEMIPFKDAIDAGAQMIMTAHIAAPAVTGTKEPTTVSYTILSEKLRGELGFKGVIITDSMGMGAITKEYDSASAAILSILAGADIILSPANFETTYNAVYNAVRNGTISESRIDESVRRILTLKKSILAKRDQLKD